MSSKIAILNRALGWLGQQPINSPVTPETSAGKALADIYEQVRKAVLATYYWNFAEVTDDATWLGLSKSPFRDEYVYPSKCMKLIKCTTDTGERFKKYRVAFNPTENTKVIQIDNNSKATLRVVYNYDVTEIVHWSPLAQEVFALMLAMGAANSVLGKENSTLKELNDLLTEMLKDATSVDGQEQPYPVEEIYQTELARLGYQDADDYDDGLLVRF